jgi:hypothetical protein
MPFFRTEGKLFEATKTLDNPDIQMIEVRYQRQLFFLAVGRAKHRPKDIATEASVEATQAKDDSKIEEALEWNFLFTPSNIPGFMQIDEFKNLAALMTSVSFGSRIQADHATYIPTVSFGGADVRWEVTQLVTNYLDSIECTNYALDEGPDVEYSTNAEITLVRFSLKNASLKKMRIVAMILDVIYTEFESREGGFCGVNIDEIEFEEKDKQTIGNVTMEIETLEKKLRTEFADIFREFVKKRTT